MIYKTYDQTQLFGNLSQTIQAMQIHQKKNQIEIKNFAEFGDKLNTDIVRRNHNNIFSPRIKLSNNSILDSKENFRKRRNRSIATIGGTNPKHSSINILGNHYEQHSRKLKLSSLERYKNSGEEVHLPSIHIKDNSPNRDLVQYPPDTAAISEIKNKERIISSPSPRLSAFK